MLLLVFCLCVCVCVSSLACRYPEEFKIAGRYPAVISPGLMVNNALLALSLDTLKWFTLHLIKVLKNATHPKIRTISWFSSVYAEVTTVREFFFYYCCTIFQMIEI